MKVHISLQGADPSLTLGKTRIPDMPLRGHGWDNDSSGVFDHKLGACLSRWVMPRSPHLLERFIGLALFLSGAGLIYATLANIELIQGTSSRLSYAWYFLAGIVLISAALLHAAGKEQGKAMKVLVYSFIALTVPLMVLTLVLP